MYQGGKLFWVEYMIGKFNADPLRIRNRIERDGHFPIRHKYVIV